MDPVVETEPDLSASVNTALGLESAPSAELIPVEPVEPPPFDPASITIPDRLVDNAPKSFEKFKTKTLLDIAKSYEEAEKFGHTKAQEAAQARKEVDELRQRLLVSEQLAKAFQKPETPLPADPWQGVNPDENIITNPRGVLDRTLNESEKRAQVVAQREAEKVRQEINAQLQREREEQAIFSTFEMAKAQVRAAGYEVSDDQWKEDLKYIAPVVARENQLFNPQRFVDHFVQLKGPVKATLPKEGNPPVASRTTAPRQSVPTMSSEDRAMRTRLADAFGFTGDDRKNYIERGQQ